MARRPIIAGNWKMNNTIAEGVALIKELAPLVADVEDVDVVACPTATALAAVAEAANIRTAAVSKILLALLLPCFVFSINSSSCLFSFSSYFLLFVHSSLLFSCEKCMRAEIDLALLCRCVRTGFLFFFAHGSF